MGNWLLVAVAEAAQSISPRTSLNFSNVEATLDKLIDVLWTVLIAVATIYFILAGYKYLTAGGNPEAARTATKMIFYGMVALAIGLVSRGLIFFVNNLIR